MEPSSAFAYVSTAETLLQTAFQAEGLSRAARLERLEHAGDRAANLLLENWESSPERAVRGIRLASVYGCAPSLDKVVRSEPHDFATAVEVSDNIQDICQHLAARGVIDSLLKSKERVTVVGQLSELAVLGTMWWGVANGQRDERTYIVPSTIQEDNGRQKDDRQLASDLILRQAGKKHRYIQVKTADSPITRRKMRYHYHPELAVVIASKLGAGTARGPIPLLRAVAEGRPSFLEKANQQIDTTLEQAKQNNIIYRHGRRANGLAHAS